MSDDPAATVIYTAAGLYWVACAVLVAVGYRRDRQAERRRLVTAIILVIWALVCLVVVAGWRD